MQSQKVNAQLNLALNTPVEERAKSDTLMVGYQPITREWDLIIRYLGDISFLETMYEAQVTVLLGGYAIVRIKESYIEDFVSHEEIIYVEKPCNIFVSSQNENRISCVSPLTVAPYYLSGKDVIVAIIDSGIDYAHPDFRNEDGTTRILALWDQTANQREAPEGYKLGTLYRQEQINQALEKNRVTDQLAIVPEVDISGHGTFVAGVAAGNGRASNGLNRGVAYEASLLIVKLGNSQEMGFPRTTELMQAIDFVVRYAIATLSPISINLSFGNNYGSHDGQALVETYMNHAIDASVGNICVGTGNEGDTGKHTSGQVKTGVGVQNPFSVAQNESAISIQIWKNYVDEFDIYIVAPDGSQIGPLQRTLGVQRYTVLQTELDIYYDLPKPYQQAQQIYIDLIPVNRFLTPGQWNIIINPIRIVDGAYNMWLPVTETNNPDTRFLFSVSDNSLTIPSTSVKSVAVGAYNSNTNAVAPFSGRGYTRTNDIKPDLVAPGVDITSCSPGGGYTVKSGTSMATPFVTGAAALLLEWGVVKGNDKYLYGEKLKSYLLKGARELPGYESYPNPQIGWGALCVRDSLPK